MILTIFDQVCLKLHVVWEECCLSHYQMTYFRLVQTSKFKEIADNNSKLVRFENQESISIENLVGIAEVARYKLR